MTPLALLLNLWSRYKITKLGAPHADRVYAETNMRQMEPLKPVLAGHQSWVWVALIAGLVTLGIINRPGPTDESSRGCLTFSRSESDFVSCDKPHDARVIAVVSDWSLCPDETENHFEYLGRFYCFVEEYT